MVNRQRVYWSSATLRPENQHGQGEFIVNLGRRNLAEMAKC